MVALRVERRISVAVEAVVESEIGVQAGAIRTNVVLGDVEGVFIVVQVANLEIPIDLIEYLRAEANILDFRPADAFQPDRPFAGRQSLANDSEHRSALKHSRPLDCQDNCQDILAVESVRTDWLETVLSCRGGLCRHRTLQEEPFRSRSCEYMQAFPPAAGLFSHR